MGQNVEIEIKHPLLNGKQVAAFLTKHAKFKYEQSQHDAYYNAPHRNFLQNPDNVNEWFRLRIANGQAQINYKDYQPHDQKIKTHCTEYEANVDSYDQLSNILEALNFTKLMDVEKVRKAWDYKDTEVSIDTVEELGEFIEIEYKGDLTDVEEARKHLFAVLQDIGAQTGELDTRGYPYLLLAKKGLL